MKGITMKYRIKELRLALKLNQNELGYYLAVGGTAVGNWERGDSPIPESKKLLLIKTFNINQTWLETGEGEMFNQPVEPPKMEQRDIVVKFIIDTFNQLEPTTQQILLDAFQKIHDK